MYVSLGVGHLYQNYRHLEFAPIMGHWTLVRNVQCGGGRPIGPFGRRRVRGNPDHEYENKRDMELFPHLGTR